MHITHANETNCATTHREHEAELKVESNSIPQMEITQNTVFIMRVWDSEKSV